MSYNYTALSDCTTAVHNADNIIKSTAPKLNGVRVTPTSLNRADVADTSSYTVNGSSTHQYPTSPFTRSLNYVNVTSPCSPSGSAIFGKPAESNSTSSNSMNGTMVTIPQRGRRYSHDPYNLSAHGASLSLLAANVLSPEESFNACYGDDEADSRPRSQEATPGAAAAHNAKRNPSAQNKKRRQQDGPSARPRPTSCTVVPHTTKQPQRRRSPADEVEKVKDATTLAAVMQQQQPVAEVSVRANVLSFFQSAALYTQSAEQPNAASEGETSPNGARPVRTVVACGRVDRTSGRPVVRALASQ